MKKMRMGIVGVAALGTLAFAAPAGATQTAPADTRAPAASSQAEQGTTSVAGCSRTRIIHDSNAVLRYQECWNRGHRKVRGVLDDRRNNGRCAWAKVRFVPHGPVKTYKDCGGHPTRFDTGWHRARDARVTLS
ncbi:hypothetical protein [Streptomyces sp. HNM0574]|uniref:hypothetical protein n=1 Tax=Streptomyces sp. HNM0574 TaxID=2714954 RepID=UPI00146E63BB|nr:hypothetical protein [Streptomyces sp. HNM0574]NLU69442.1 hypothetical protein [Streptomyces sp. HNM0574]